MRNWIILLVMLANSACKAQSIASSCVKCDMKKVSSVYSKKKENIAYADVKDFLCTVSAECKSNAEFSEFSNETLYTLLEKRPEIVIDVLTKEKGFDTKYIYEIITRPINDSLT